MISETSQGRLLLNLGVLAHLVGKRDMASLDTEGAQGADVNSQGGPAPPLTQAF